MFINVLYLFLFMVNQDKSSMFFHCVYGLLVAFLGQENLVPCPTRQAKNNRSWLRISRLSLVLKNHPIPPWVLPRSVRPKEKVLDALTLAIRSYISSGQLRNICHQPRFSWNKEISLPQLPFGGAYRRVRSLQFDVLSLRGASWAPNCPKLSRLHVS